MPIQSETTTIFLILALAIGVIVWGYQRGKKFGKIGILAWLQSLVLMAPWLIFFGLFVLGIYVNLIGIVLLLVASAGIYIYLGKQLRTMGQEELLRMQAQERIARENLDEEKLQSLAQAVQDEITKHQIPQGDLEEIKGIFGIDTFFATQTIPYQEGAVFQGNLRGEEAATFQRLSEKLQTKCGDRYRLFLVENPEEKPVVIVLPKSSDPPTTTTGQKNLSLLLMVATLATSLEAISLLLGFDLFQSFTRAQEALPYAIGIWGVLLAHEWGHRYFAQKHDVKLSWPFFIPSWQLASFGSITRLESYTPNRSALFDIAFGGPAAGGLLSLLLLVTGMTLSHPGTGFQISGEFLQGSILVGTLARVILGDGATAAVIDIHPLMAIGWLGLVITALNLLPAGQLDGGRMVLAIYGRKIARRASFITLALLGLISLFNPANPIPFYWALIILFLQRGQERPSMNELTEPDDTRAALALLALFLTLTVLIPLTPNLAGRLGIGN